MNIKCIIVEDEPLAMERVKMYAGKLPYLTVLATFDNGADALVYIHTQAVDLILLDINIGELSGIGLLEHAHFGGQVIFTTAYPDYALKGYELNVTDYLLKPFTFERFVRAVEKAKANLGKTSSIPTEQNFIFIKTEYRLEKVFLHDILYIEGMRDYRRIHTAHKRIMTLQTFKELEQEIPPGIICRVHKSYMVSLGKIKSIEKDEISIGDKIIPVSDTYKKDFLALLNRGKK